MKNLLINGVTYINVKNIELPTSDGGIANYMATPVEEIEITENGTYEVLDYAKAKVNVPIPEGYIKPEGNLDITENGTYDIKNYESAKVNVPIPDGYVKPDGTLEVKENGTKDVTNYKNVEVNIELNPNLQEKTVTPSKEIQEVTADEGYDGLDKVKVDSIPSEYIVPNGELSITENGEVDVKSYEKVNVNVPVPSTEGTAIKPDEIVDRIYWNTNISIDEVNAYLSQLTYVDFQDAKISGIYSNVTEEYKGHNIFSIKVTDDVYIIRYQKNLPIGDSVDIFDSKSGWLSLPLNTLTLPILDGPELFFNELHFYLVPPGAIPITNFQGLPIGAENEKIKNVLSTTPFVAEGSVAIEEFDGTVEVVETTITFTISGVEYQADNGMTWEQWCGTEYNTYGFNVSGNSIMTTMSGVAPDYIQYNGIDVLPSDEIISGEYTLRREDIGGW